MTAVFILLASAAFSQRVDSATVYVRFRIDTSGNITNIKAYKVTCRKCSRAYKETIKKEAEKVIKANPYWEQPISEPAKYIQPIRFKLEKE